METKEAIGNPTDDDDMLGLLSPQGIFLTMTLVLRSLLTAAGWHLAQIIHACEHLSNNAAFHFPLRILSLGSNSINLICKPAMLQYQSVAGAPASGQ